MSRKRNPNDSMEKGAKNPYAAIKEAIHERDRQKCTCCLGERKIVEKLDVDHNVPRGVGGSEVYSNQSSLCRRCHDAKEGNGIAPTVQLESTGRMDDVEFLWFKHLIKEILPTLARTYDVRLRPKFDLKNCEAWYYPLGDLRRLDIRLCDEIHWYCSMQASEFM